MKNSGMLLNLDAHRRLFNLFTANAKKGSFRADASENVIELYDMICSSDAEAEWFGGVSLQGFSKALRGMNGTTHLRINSPGGDVFAGVGMAQLMREYSAKAGNKLVAHVDGYAASAASIVAIAADQVIMAPASMMMIHKAWTWGIGNSDDLLETANLLEKIDGQLADSYAGKGNKTAAEFLAMMSAESWLTPQEALDCGLCDELAPEADKSAKNSVAWDLSAFGHAPKPSETTEEDPAAALAAAAEVEAAAIAAAQEIEDRERRDRMLAVIATAA